MAGSSQRGPMCTTRGDYIDDGTLGRNLSPLPGPICGYSSNDTRSPFDNDGAGRRAVDMILDAVDKSSELNGAGVIMKFPAGDSLLLREPAHDSGLATIVLADIQLSKPAEMSWWQKWNGVILNCGGAAISWTGVGVSAAAELPSAGTSTVLLVASYAGATATTAQCGLAVAKVSSEDFQEYVQSSDGQWINTADLVLDVISLAGGAAGAVSALKTSGKLLKTSKYAAALENLDKGKLVKWLERIEKAEEDLGYFREALGKAIKEGKVLDPVGNKLSNNLLKRALPLMTSSLRKELLANLSNVFGQALSTWSSSYGGSGSKNLGVVKIIVSVFQEPIIDP